MKMVSFLLICLLLGEMRADDKINIYAYRGGALIITYKNVLNCERISPHWKSHRDGCIMDPVQRGKYQFGKLDIELLPVPSTGQDHELQRTVGGSVEITCDFSSYRANREKFLCMGADRSTCTRLSDDRYSVTNGQNGKTFKATINNLAKADAGVYWCGWKVTRSSLSYTNLYIRMQLIIIGTTSTTTTTSQATTRPSTFQSTPHPGEPTKTTRENITSKVTVGPMSTQTTPSSALQPSSPTGIIVAVVVCLFVALVLGFIMLLFRYKKKHGVTSSSESMNNYYTDNDMVAVNAQSGVTGTGLRTIYAQLPTAPSGVPLYSMLQLPPEPSPCLTYTSIRFNPAGGNNAVAKEDTSTYYSTVKTT
ncbi:CMRF35-like molecule 8 [Alosa sapidissima]|uniref:CMRF35-like molecule 8 n=1 Tax=Alosa sapidissima TaxID=34773 RepID=UPI001C083D52|nr:CMRF35-like molecule 8 [Alosa sapidissima]